MHISSLDELFGDKELTYVDERFVICKMYRVQCHYAHNT
jgi:hypothetical protein